MAAIVFQGTPGEQWVNQTQEVWYQWECSFINSCTYCIGMHGVVSRLFYLPAHSRCRCRANMLAPGASGFPWVDMAKVIENLPRAKQKTAIGKSILILIDAGTITLEDAVTGTRAKTLAEIVQAKGLSENQLIAAGVDPKVAKEAANAPHITEEQALAMHREAQRKKLANAGLTREQIQDGLGTRDEPQTPNTPATTPGTPGSPPESPERVIRRARVVVDRLQDLAGVPRDAMPSFADHQAVRDWVEKFPAEVVATVTPDEWVSLLAVVGAQRELDRLFKRLRVDRDKAMKAIAP